MLRLADVLKSVVVPKMERFDPHPPFVVSLRYQEAHARADVLPHPI